MSCHRLRLTLLLPPWKIHDTLLWVVMLQLAEDSHHLCILPLGSSTHILRRVLPRRTHLPLLLILQHSKSVLKSHQTVVMTQPIPAHGAPFGTHKHTHRERQRVCFSWLCDGQGGKHSREGEREKGGEEEPLKLGQTTVESLSREIHRLPSKLQACRRSQSFFGQEYPAAHTHDQDTHAHTPTFLLLLHIPHLSRVPTITVTTFSQCRRFGACGGSTELAKTTSTNNYMLSVCHKLSLHANVGRISQIPTGGVGSTLCPLKHKTKRTEN